VFTDEELESLRRFPEIGREELFRFFTLTPADSAFIDPGLGRGPADRLGLAVAVCTLVAGFGPDDADSAPPAAVARLAEQPRIPLPSANKTLCRSGRTRRSPVRRHPGRGS
jgi:hypothetical protein